MRHLRVPICFVEAQKTTIGKRSSHDCIKRYKNSARVALTRISKRPNQELKFGKANAD